MSRHRRLRRIARWTAGALAGLVVLAGLALWYGLSSESAARRLIALGLSRTGDAIRIGRTRGSLRGPLTLYDVRIRKPAYSAAIDSVRLEWTPTGLLRREMRIDRLIGMGVHLVLPDSVPRDTARPTRPDLPMEVKLGDVRAIGLTVRAPASDSLTLADGTLRLTGRAKDYRLEATARATTPQLENIPVRLSGRGDLEHLDLDTASLGLLDGRVTGAGRVGWYPRTSWTLAARVERVRPSLLLARASAAALPGLVSGRARTAGYLDSTGAHGRLAVDSVSGRLRGRSIGGLADVGFAGKALDIRALDGRWGTTRLVASGTAGDTLDLRFRATVADLRGVTPSARGSIASEGTVRGPRTAALVRATLDGRRVAYGTNKLGRVSGTLAVGMAPSGRLDVRLRAAAAAIGRQTVDSLLLAIVGTRPRHRVDTRVFAAETEIDAAASGGIAGAGTPRWRGTIDSLIIVGTPAGDWHLERPASLSAAAAATSLSELCLAADSTRACAGGEWRSLRDWHAVARLERLPLTLAERFVPDSLVPGQALAGAIDGRLDARATRGRLDGRAHLGTAGASFAYRQAPTDTASEHIVFDTASADLVLGDSGVRGAMRLRFVATDRSPVGAVSATFALPAYTTLGQAMKPQPIEARLQARIENLALARAVYPQLDSLTGLVTAGATAAGTVGAPRVTADLALERVAAWLAGNRVARGSVTAKLAAAIDSARHVDATLGVVPRGVVYDYPLAGVPQRIAVDSGGFDLRAGADGVHGRVALGLTDSAGGRLATVRGHLELPQYRTLGDSLATQPVTLQFTGDLPTIAFFRAFTTRVDSLGGRLRFDLGATGTVGAPKARGTLRLTDLAARLPSSATVTGGMEGDLSYAVAADSAIAAAFRLTPRGVALAFGRAGSQRRLTLADTGVVVRIGADGIRGSLELRLTDASAGQIGTVSGRLALPRYTRIGMAIDSQPVSATLGGRIDDLAFVQAFTPQVDSLAARAVVDARVGGTVARPDVSGGLRLDASTARLALLGVTYRDIHLSATADSAGTFALRGGVHSGPGTLALTGRTPLRPTVERPARLHLQGQSFQAIDVPEVRAIVSPTLDVVVAGDSIDARGDVQLPFVRIELTDIPERAVPPTDDVVFVDSLATDTSTTWRVSSRIRIALGDSVTFKGFNFEAKLGGQLLLIQEPGREPIGSGGIAIEEGRYKAYGQDLTITDGQIRFAGGPVTDPSLALRAVRVATDSTVAGLDIAGTLTHPQVTIFSNPPMSESRALAYIILGKPPGETSGASGDLLSKAATSLGLRGGNLLARAVGSNLGLSDVKIESAGDVQKASLVAGKYLAPNLYVSYGLGLFDPSSILRLRYDLSPRFTIQAERGAATGADILFRTERGRGASSVPGGVDTGLVKPQ